MRDCDHSEYRYARFTTERGTTHYAVECLDCGKLIKTAKHGGKLLIKHHEVPVGVPVFERGVDI